MPSELLPIACLESLASHPRGEALATLAFDVALASADAHERIDPLRVAEAAGRAGVSRSDAELALGNGLDALEGTPSLQDGPGSRLLCACLVARGAALRADRPADARLAEAFLWLATHTHIDVFPVLDVVLGPAAEAVWRALGARLVARASEEAPSQRAELLTAAAALRQCSSERVRADVAALAPQMRDSAVGVLLSSMSMGKAGAPTEPETSTDVEARRGVPVPSESPRAESLSVELRGERVVPPRSVVAFVGLGCTGLLAVAATVRLCGRLLLGYKRSSDLQVSPTGITITTTTHFLGKPIRRQEQHMPREGLQSLTRELQYPKLVPVVGVVALSLGTYFGVRLLMDGVRAGAPELLAFGCLLVALGIGLDYAMERLIPKRGGRCSIVIVPRKGASVALGRVDPLAADRAFALISEPR